MNKFLLTQFDLHHRLYNNVPDEFIKELSKNKKAKAFYETLNKTNKYAIGWRLQTAKKPETKEKRIKMIIEMLSKGQKFH